MNQKRKMLSLIGEVKGDLYQQLIAYGSQHCNEVILVVRPGISLDNSGTKILDFISPYLKEKTQSQDWPGTHLVNGYAWVYHYYLTPELSHVLLRSTDHLYAWLQPKLPEDLCLIRPDQEPWLVTISHEQDSYLYLSESELNEFLSKMPLISTILQSDI